MNTAAKTYLKIVTVSISGAVSANFVNAGTAISAPILPISINDAVSLQGDKYPSDKAEQLKIVQDNFKSYEHMLNQCSTRIDGIVLGDNLSDSQIMQNYQLTAECSYKLYGSKPYYMPQLIADVDFCREVLGGDFRMITESDVRTFTPQFYQELNQVLSSASTSQSFGVFYFSLNTYIRGDDGSIKVGLLGENVTGPRVLSIPTSVNPRNLLIEMKNVEGKIVLRCMRTD